MAGADAFMVCPLGHRNDDVAVYCRTCRRLLLVRILPSDNTMWNLQIMVVTIATLGAAVLFRLTDQILPVYLYLILGLTFLYAVVFSRGRGTVSVAAGTLGLVTLLWLLFWLTGRELSPSAPVPTALYVLSAAVWLIGVVAVFVLRRWSLPVAREPGTYVLAGGVFTLGFWGVWAALLRGDLVSTPIFQTAVALAFVAPLAFIPLIRKWRPYQGEPGSLVIWVAIVVLYAVVADQVVRGLVYVLGQLFPHILGLAPLAPLELPIGSRVVRAVLAVAVLGMILLYALIDSIVVVWRRFSEPEPAGSQRQIPAGEHGPGGRVEQVVRATVKGTAGPGAFVVDVLQEFLAKFRGFARLINLVVPLVVFTALSFLLILTLDVVREYGIYGAFASPFGIWGVAILAMFLALVGYAVAVYYAPWAYDAPRPSPSNGSPMVPGSASNGTSTDTGSTTLDLAPRASSARTRNWPSIASGSAVLLVGFYVFVSVASLTLLAMWLTLRALDKDPGLTTPGPVYLLNMLSVLVVVAAFILIGLLIDWAAQRRRQSALDGATAPRPQLIDRAAVAARYVLPLMLAALAGLAMLAGARPTIDAVSFAARAPNAMTDKAAVDELRGKVPANIRAGCSRDHLALTSARIGLRCALGPDQGVVSYHLFADDDEMNRVYGILLTGDGRDPESARCGDAPDDRHGQVGCYTYGGAAWVVWTDDRFNVLSLYYQTNGDMTSMYQHWRTGELGPVPAQP